MAVPPRLFPTGFRSLRQLPSSKTGRPGNARESTRRFLRGLRGAAARREKQITLNTRDPETRVPACLFLLPSGVGRFCGMLRLRAFCLPNGKFSICLAERRCYRLRCNRCSDVSEFRVSVPLRILTNFCFVNARRRLQDVSFMAGSLSGF